MERLLTRNSWTYWRTFDMIDTSDSSENYEKVFSRWIDLEKDEFYYF